MLIGNIIHRILCIRHLVLLKGIVIYLSFETALASPFHKAVCPYKTRTSCSPGLCYHCIPDENDQHGDICLEWKWIQGGRCPYYNSALQDIDSFPCDTKRLQGCPDVLYQSHNLSGFDACYLTLKSPLHKRSATNVEYTQTTEGSNSRTEIWTIPRERYKTTDEVWFHLVISGAVCLITIACVVLVLWYYFARMTKEMKKQKGSEEVQLLKETNGKSSSLSSYKE